MVRVGLKFAMFVFRTKTPFVFNLIVGKETNIRKCIFHEKNVLMIELLFLLFVSAE